MPSATLNSKGQVTIPIEVRNAMGLNAGDRIEFIDSANGVFTLVAATRSVVELKGMIPKPEKPVSIQDMNVAIELRGLLKPT